MRTLPNLGLQAFFALGEDGWDDEMSLNLLKLSVLTQGRVLSKVAAEPGSPTDGDIHILDETHATHPNEIAIRDDGAWVYVTPLSGWLLYNVAAGYYEKYDADEGRWAELETGGGAGAGGGLVKLGSIEAVGGETSLTVDNIPGGYENLVITGSARGSADSNIILTLNGDASPVYDFDRQYGGGTNSGTAYSNVNGFHEIWGMASVANIFNGIKMTLFGYARTDRFKAFEASSAFRSTSGTRLTMQAAGYWKDTDAITSITATASSGTFAAGSRLDVWGMGESSVGKSAVFEDQKAAGTAGGASVAGSWLTRDLNTEVFDDIGITLASNQLTLPAGTYDVEAFSTLYRTERCRVRLQDVTNNVTLALSLGGQTSNAGDFTVTALPVVGRFTLANSATVELQYRVLTAQASNGLGVEGNFGVVEIYSRVKLTKVV